MKRHNGKLAWRLPAVIAATALAMAWATVTHAPAATREAVGIKDFTYSPATLTVPVGATVTWINHDEEPHTITSAAGAFGSAGLSHEETFARTFTDRGTYQYFCALHPRMRATVIVK
jgi:plastocyanin